MVPAQHEQSLGLGCAENRQRWKIGIAFAQSSFQAECRCYIGATTPTRIYVAYIRSVGGNCIISMAITSTSRRNQFMDCARRADPCGNETFLAIRT